MFKEYSFNKICSKHYLNPGEDLDDLALMKLYKSLMSINNSRAEQVDNLYIRDGHSIEELKEIYSSCIITLFEDESSPFGFLISPIIKSDVGYIFHGGLIIFTRNPGGDFMGLAALCNSCMAYEKYGQIFATNISSTPSIIEVFTNTITKVWPSPKMNLKKIPNNYKKVLNALKTQYMDKYFPEDSNVIIDERRFTMSSNSSGMGFSTNYYKLSRANKYVYQSFCKTWINYEESEDIIQVGKITFSNYLLQKLKLVIVKKRLKSLKKTHKIQKKIIKEEIKKVA